MSEFTLVKNLKKKLKAKDRSRNGNFSDARLKFECFFFKPEGLSSTFGLFHGYSLGYSLSIASIDVKSLF